jgi:two-component system, cell cycle response regulator DivK
MTRPPPETLSERPEKVDRPLVLIVDDNEQNVTLARDVLRVSGFQTVEASTGAEGIALAAEHLPDVVLLDLRLPDMGGTDAARRLRAHPRTAGIPLVALSAMPLEGEGDWLADAGFAGYLGKPIRVSEFPAQIRRYCP